MAAADDVWGDPALWHDLATRAHTTKGSLEISLAAGSIAWHRGPPDARVRGSRRGPEAEDNVADRWFRLTATHHFDGLAVLTVEPAGDYQVRLYPPGTPEHELVLVPGALPAPFRDLAPRPAARQARNDPARIAALIRKRVAGSLPAQPAQLHAFAAALGFPVPPALAAIWTVAEQAPSVPVGRRHSFRLQPPDPRYLSYLTGLARAGGQWRYGASEPLDLRDTDPVRQLGHSRGWIPFGDNGGGDLYCLDLNPGPTGTTGQVICVWHEETVGASLVADSLEHFLKGRWHQLAGRAVDPRLTAMMHHGTSVRPPDLAGADLLQVLQVGSIATPLDLQPCLGLPSLRTFRAASPLARPEQVLSYPALEFLSLVPSDWDRVLAAGPLPRSLLAVGVEDDGAPVPRLAMLARLAVEAGLPTPPPPRLITGLVGN